jgi:hypothetical protein
MSSPDKPFDNLFLPSDSAKLPYCDGTKYLLNGEIISYTGKVTKVHSPIWKQGATEPVAIGNHLRTCAPVSGRKKKPTDNAKKIRNVCNVD